MVYSAVHVRWLEAGLFILLVGIAILSLSWGINRQLVDYDEAIYAQVVVDTINQGDMFALKLAGANWFEKPPLYIWLSMLSVQALGEYEYAFRIPSVLASVLACILVYLIVMQLTGSILASSLGFLVLLFSNSFFIYAREARLDSAVIVCVLLAMLFFIKGWKHEKYFIWVFPCIAIGFLFKSVIAFLAIPIILIYCSFYKQWSFLSSRYTWWGAVIGASISIPWHLVETIRFGSEFWRSYMGQQIFQRAITTYTGSNNIFDYAKLFIPWYLPWNGVLFLILPSLVYFRRSFHTEWKYVRAFVIAPLASALFIFVIFTAARTHLSPYIMPAFPFFAIAIAVGHYHLRRTLHSNKILISLTDIIMIAAILYAAWFCVRIMYEKVPSYTIDERAIGQIYSAHDTHHTPLYVLDWLAVESLSYYGKTKAQSVNPDVIRGTVVEGPFYLVISPVGLTYFFYNNQASPIEPGIQALYVGKDFALIYVDHDIKMPMFQTVPRAQ